MTPAQRLVQAIVRFSAERTLADPQDVLDGSHTPSCVWARHLALDALSQLTPLSRGEIAAAAGLTPQAVTYALLRVHEQCRLDAPRRSDREAVLDHTRQMLAEG